MKIKLAFIILVSICFWSCTQNQKTNTHSKSVEKIDTFFPVTSFLKGQMNMLDSLPITPLHFITANNKTDSFWLKKEELRSFLQPFFTPEIKETNLTSLFKESKFEDLSIGAITFTYEPVKELPDTISLNRWDVYVNPETGKVSKIYLVKNIREGDKNITQQLTWLTDKGAKIVTLSAGNNEKTELLKEDRFVWSF